MPVLTRTFKVEVVARRGGPVAVSRAPAPADTRFAIRLRPSSFPTQPRAQSHPGLRAQGCQHFRPPHTVAAETNPHPHRRLTLSSPRLLPSPMVQLPTWGLCTIAVYGCLWPQGSRGKEEIMRFRSMQHKTVQPVTTFGLFFAMFATALILAVMAAWLATAH